MVQWPTAHPSHMSTCKAAGISQTASEKQIEHFTKGICKAIGLAVGLSVQVVTTALNQLAVLLEVIWDRVSIVDSLCVAACMQAHAAEHRAS